MKRPLKNHWIQIAYVFHIEIEYFSYILKFHYIFNIICGVNSSSDCIFDNIDYMTSIIYDVATCWIYLISILASKIIFSIR